MSSTELAQRFADGGEEELEELVGLFGERLLRYATAILCDYQEAEDVVQEVFLSAYGSRSAFDGENLAAWLYKITYNRSLNQLKKRRLFYFGNIRERTAALPEESKGLSDDTLCALRKLKPKERALLYGRIMEGQSYEELALLSGQSAPALRKQYERAKKKLAGYLSAGRYGKEPKHECI